MNGGWDYFIVMFHDLPSQDNISIRICVVKGMYVM